MSCTKPRGSGPFSFKPAAFVKSSQHAVKSSDSRCWQILFSGVHKPPEGPDWTYEIKLDGYRLEAVKSKGKILVYSRRRNVLNEKFSYIAESLENLPDETVLDGEIVAVDEEGRSNFNLPQNFRSSRATRV
jgi:ATP-dependent DNA ligase